MHMSSTSSIRWIDTVGHAAASHESLSVCPPILCPAVVGSIMIRVVLLAAVSALTTGLQTHAASFKVGAPKATPGARSALLTMEEKESGDKVVIGASLVGGVAGALFFGNPVGAAALAILAATGASPAKAKDEIVPEVATSPLSVVASPPPVAAQKTSAAVPAAPGSASAASEAMSGRQVAELSSKLSELESQLSASSAPSAALRAKEEEVAMLTTKLTVNEAKLADLQAQLAALKSGAPAAEAAPADGASSAMAAMEAEADRVILEIQLVFTGRSVSASLPATSTTDALSLEARRLLGLQGQGISLLVNGVRLAPGVPLTKTKVLSYANDEVVTENVVVLTSARGEKWKAPAGKMAAETVAAMAAEEAARTVLDVQIVYNGRSVCASIAPVARKPLPAARSKRSPSPARRGLLCVRA